MGLVKASHCFSRDALHNGRVRRACCSIAAVMTFCVPLSAAAADLTLRSGYLLFTFGDAAMAKWHGEEERWTFDGIAISPPASLRSDGDDPPALPPGFARSTVPAWDRTAIEQALRASVLPSLEREAGTVVIHSASGSATFEGVGLTGRRLDVDRAIDLIIVALDHDITNVELPVTETQPSITVDDDLAARGIREVIAVGESDFRGSPTNRRHNIGVGLKRFSGHRIAQGATFSFNEVLGPVDQTTGYRKELTIKGDKTLPDYGGGLCQISSTAYRGAWQYGLPIAVRRNHSYAVHYYAPLGTDATIYPPSADIRFINDTPGDIVIQTHQENDHAYFIYYGTRDNRVTTLAGPYVWDRQSPPPSKTEYTTELAPGETRKVGEAVPGMKVMWFRTVASGTGSATETFYSAYEARPLFHQIGVAPIPTEAPSDVLKPPQAASSSSSRLTARPKSVEPPSRRRQ